MISVFLLLLVQAVIISAAAFALSDNVSAASTSISMIKIVGLPSGGGNVPQSLPISYVEKTFQRWTVDEDGRIVSQTTTSCSRVQNEIEYHSSTTSNDDDERWEVRPSLDVLVRSGEPLYVMSGLQLRKTSHHRSSSGADIVEENMDTDGGYCPLARQWTSFSFAVEPSFRVETFLTRSDSDEPEALVSSSSISESTAAVSRMKSAMELFGVLLSQMDDDSPMSEGFHIVSIPLDHDDWISLPVPDNEGGSPSYTVTCLATAEPVASELIGMDETLLEMTASSILELSVRRIPAATDECNDNNVNGATGEQR